MLVKEKNLELFLKHYRKQIEIMARVVLQSSYKTILAEENQL